MEDEFDSQWQFLRLIRSTAAQDGQDVPLDNLHFIVDWWVLVGNNYSDRKSAVAELLQKLDEAATRSAVPSERNNEGRTALHMSVMRNLPDQFIVQLLNYMQPADIAQRDDCKRTALDYLLDQDDMSISSDVFQAFVTRNADFTGGQGCTMTKCPLATLCRRRADGHLFLDTVIDSLNPTTWDKYKNCMLEEAIKTGSNKTVKLLLANGANPNAKGKFLLHAAADANHENVTKVKVLLSHSGCDADQKDQGGQTLLHRAAGGKPPRVEIMKLALHFKTDINKQDKKGDTALHKVAANYAGRNTEWKQSVDVMRRLLLHERIEPNIRNKKGLTPLQKLFEAKRNLPESLVLEWVEAKADFTGCDGDTTSMSSNPSKATPLAMLATRKDGPKLFTALSVPLKDVMMKNLQLMLEAAVKTGTAEMVKLLLHNGANANTGKGRLLLLAADSTVQAALKIKHLVSAGAKHQSDGKGYTALHVAASSSATSDDVLKTCVDSDVLNLSLEETDKDDNTPLHLAAMNCNQGSIDLVRYLVKNGDPNIKNKHDETPLQLVLEGPKELRQIKLAFLLENGCQPNETDIKSFKGNVEDFEDLFLSTEVIGKSQDPIKLLILLGKYCQDRDSSEKQERRTWNKAQWRRSLKWGTLNEKLQEEAILMIEELGNDDVLDGVMTNEDIKDIDDLKWHKLLANENIGRLLLQMFNGLVDAADAETDRHSEKRANKEKWYHFLDLIFLFLLQSLLIPLYLLSFPLCCCYHCCCCQCDKDDFISILPINPQKIPIVTFGGSLIGYVIFLGFLMARIIVGDDEGEFSWLDWIILLYIVAMATEELYQIITRGLAYCNVTNTLDVLVVVLFIAFYALRAIGSTSDNLLGLRLSEHVFAVAAALAFIRVLYYMQIHRRLGPIQISFGEITTEVVSFLIILSVFLLSFGIAISGVYNAGIYTDLYRNQSVGLPEKFTGLWPSLQTLYWSLYGQIEYTELESSHDEFAPEVTVGLILFAFWSLVSVVVLLNMLIAVISEAFDRVKNANAELVRHRAISRIISDIRESPSFPLPINLFYLLILVLFAILDKIAYDYDDEQCRTCQFDKTGEGEKGKDPQSTTARTMASRLTAAYQKKKQEQELDKMQSEMQQSLKQHSEQMKLQVAGQLETMRSRLQRQLTSQTKRVRKHLKRLPNAARVDQVYGAPDESDGPWLRDASESDSDDTDDDVQDADVRYERVNLNGNTVSYAGSGREPGVFQLLRSPISSEFKYYEVTILDYGEEGAIGVGLAKRNYPLNQMPGWRVNSVAFHCDDGKLFHERGFGEKMATPAQQGDVIGCGVDGFSYDDDEYLAGRKVTVFFTRNGVEIGRTKVTLPKGGLFPTLGLVSEGEAVSFNLNAKWPPVERKVEDETAHPVRALRLAESRLHFNGNGDILSYKSTSQGGVGIFQDLNYPISEESNYFKVKILDLGIRGTIGIGVAPRNYPLDRMPGWEGGSIAYHCDDGVVFRGPSRGRSTYTPADEGEVIGCGVKFIAEDTKRAKVFFSRNGEIFDESVADIPPGGFYPTIGMMSPGEEIQIDTEAKWQTESTHFTAESVVESRSERVHVDGEFIEYVGDRYRNVGVFQSLSQRMDHEFSYYEIEVIDYGTSGTIAVGLAKNDYSLNRQPGWDKDSVAWHCDDGHLFKQTYNINEERDFPPAEEGDVIGCGIDFKRSRAEEGDVAVVFFTRNGEQFASTVVDIPDGGFYPTIGMHSDGETVRLNLSVDWNPKSAQTTNRSLGTEIASSRVRIVGDKVAYIGDAYNHVGGVQLLSYPISNLNNNYYEVKVVDAGERKTIGIGLALRGYPLDCQPGWVPGSIAYHCDDGILYFDGDSKKDFFQPTTTASTNDVIGCGIREKPNKDGQSELFVFFTHNHVDIGKEVSWNLPANELHPCIGMHSRGEVVQINLAATYPPDSRKQAGTKSGRNEQLFSRAERVVITGKVVEYEANEYESVGVVQVDRQMTKDFSYYEVTIMDFGTEGAIGVGLARKDYPLDCEPGWVSGSVGFHSDDGKLFTGDGFGRQFSDRSRSGQVIGCGIEWNSKDSEQGPVTVFFTRDGERLGQNEIERIPVPVGGFFPTIGMCSPGEKIEVNIKAVWCPKEPVPPPVGFANLNTADDRIETTTM